MDWLSAYHVFFDCFRRRVNFLAPSGETCVFIGDHLSFPTLSLHLLHWRSGHGDYLANFLVNEEMMAHGYFSLVVCEFVDEFP